MAAEVVAPPMASLVYTWEPSNAAIARRYGLRPEEILRFDTNTSPVPPGDLIRQRLAQATDPALNEYPDSSYEELTLAIARYNSVAPEQVLVGAGADEVLDLVGKAFLPAGGAAIVPTPTYGMYAVLTAQRAARMLAIPRLEAERDYALDLGAIIRVLGEAQVLWLCAPNNPTGTLDSEATLRALLDSAMGLPQPPVVVVDEAYFEFVDRTLVPLTERYPNLVVVRTLSKAFALAGIRVGYAIAARPTIERLERVRPPGSISTISAVLASAALADPELARANVTTIAGERDWFTVRLGEAGYRVHSSVTNFLLLRVGGAAAAAELSERLLRRGMVPRTFGVDHPLAGHLRLTVRSRPENARLLEVLA
jgi:histidinol-phosphate aminotransferase